MPRRCGPYNKIDQNDYVSNINLPKSDDNLLLKCLHGSKKSVNEALNQIIWNKCPKQVFVERKMLEIGVYSAILEYNNGVFGIQNVLKWFNVASGVCFG